MREFWKAHWDARHRLSVSPQCRIVRCEKRWQWDVQTFSDWDLWLVLEGSGQLTIGQVNHPISEGFSICFPPGEWNIHAEHDPAQPLYVFYCHFDLVQVGRKTTLSIPEPSPVRMATDPLLWSTVRELASSFDADASPALQENLLWQLLLRRERSEPFVSSSAEDRVRSLIQRIRESPAEVHDIEQLAQEAAMSTGHFRRVFQKISGQSPVQYVINRRIERAAYYLNETSLPIQMVSTTVGYKDVYFFSRQFKERTGMSPTDFRKAGATSPFAGH